MKKILIVTNIPSYHQVDLFNKLSENRDVDLLVFYLLNKTVDRHWNKEFTILHPHKFIEYKYISKRRGVYYNPSILKKIKEFNPNQLILTQYANITQQFLLYYYWLIKKNVSLFFWSEKPGIPHYEVPIIKSRLIRGFMRKISLLPIIKNRNLKIWGIGNKSVNYFEKITHSKVENFPYYLNIKRFKYSGIRTYQGKINVLFAGKFNKRKGFDILLEFLKTSNKEFLANFKFTFIGTGDYEHDLVALKNQFNYINYEGFVERQEMPLFYNSNDVFLFPGRYDGWGMVINEGMASGLIMLGSKNIGAVEDCLIDGVNGFLIQENINSIQEKLLWILNNKKELEKISTNAKQTSIQNDVINGYKKFYKLIG